MQEAHHPPHSKCSLCCSVQWGGGPRDGVSPPQTWGTPRHGVPPQTWGTSPDMGTPRTWGTPLPYPDLRWGTPTPDMGWVTPPTIIQTWPGSPPDLRWGTPTPDMGWVTPPHHHPDLAGVPPRPEMGYPPTSDLRWGNPPLPHKCEQTENITFPHPSDAGGNNIRLHSWNLICVFVILAHFLTIHPTCEVMYEGKVK